VGACVFALLLAVAGGRTRAADPLPYQVDLAQTHDATLDQALHDASTLIALRTNAPVGPFALVARARDDSTRFLAALHSVGYYQATIGITIDGHPLDDPGLIDALEQASTAQVNVTFTEGPLFHLGTVTIDGTLPAGFQADLALHTGAPARAEAVLAAGALLLTRLRDAGYALARVDPPTATLHPDGRTLDVAFAVQSGPRVDLGPITVTGLKDVNGSYVQNRVTLKQGQVFDPAKIEAQRQDLASLGVFSEVRAEPATALDGAGQLPLRFVVTEAKPRSVDAGVSYSTDLGIGLSAGWHHHNLFGNAEQLNLTATTTGGGTAETRPGYNVGAQFIKPDFFARDQTLQVSVNAVRQDLKAYDQDALLENVTLSRPLWPHWTAHAGLSGEQEYITQEDVGRSYDLVGLPLGIAYDSSNNLLNPTAGIRASVNVTPMHSMSGAGATFTIMQVSAATYLDVSGNGRSVVALRGLVGLVSGAGQFDLPPDQRFYAGGSATVRGFRYQSVGPQFSDGNPQGGTAISAGTVELRQRLWGNWGMAAFVDAGQVSANSSPFSEAWRVGVGAGVRYFTSIGPIRLDVAVPTNRPAGSDSFELYIGLGQAF
jgi:translocation and assembly module TamA